jgi:hypothetical protein
VAICAEKGAKYTPRINADEHGSKESASKIRVIPRESAVENSNPHRHHDVAVLELVPVLGGADLAGGLRVSRPSPRFDENVPRC